MRDSDDLLGEEFEWKDEPPAGTGDASGEPAPSRPPRSLKSDLDRVRDQATASPRRLVLLTLAGLVCVALVVAVVVRAGGDKQAGSPAQTTSPATTATTPPQTQPQPAAAPPAGAAIAVSAAATLRAGDDGPAVRTLQRALRRLGFAAGSVDGVFGPKTEAAVIAFQHAHGLSADGVVGANTARALNRALARAG